MKSMSIIEELRNESVKSMKSAPDSEGDDDSQDDGEELESFEVINGKIVRKSGVRLSKSMNRRSKKNLT